MGGAPTSLSLPDADPTRKFAITYEASEKPLGRARAFEPRLLSSWGA